MGGPPEMRLIALLVCGAVCAALSFESSGKTPEHSVGETERNGGHCQQANERIEKLETQNAELDTRNQKMAVGNQKMAAKIRKMRKLGESETGNKCSPWLNFGQQDNRFQQGSNWWVAYGAALNTGAMALNCGITFKACWSKIPGTSGSSVCPALLLPGYQSCFSGWGSTKGCLKLAMY